MLRKHNDASMHKRKPCATPACKNVAKNALRRERKGQMKIATAADTEALFRTSSSSSKPRESCMPILYTRCCRTLQYHRCYCSAVKNGSTNKRDGHRSLVKT